MRYGRPLYRRPSLVSGLPAKRSVPHEENACIELNGYLELIYQRYPHFTWTHIPNGGLRHKKTAVRLKQMGCRKGVWDYYFRSLRPATCSDDGLVYKNAHWIEMKYGRNGLTDEQKDWRTLLEPLGDTFAVCKTPLLALDSLIACGIIPAGCYEKFGMGIRILANF